VRDDGSAAMIDTKQIHVDNALPFLDWVFPCFVIGAGNTGIRDKYIDMSMLVDRRQNCSVHGSSFRNID
jgi:hypothetical protein